MLVVEHVANSNQQSLTVESKLEVHSATFLLYLKNREPQKLRDQFFFWKGYIRFKPCRIASPISFEFLNVTTESNESKDIQRLELN